MHIQYEIRDQSFFCTTAKNLHFPVHLHRHCELIYLTDGVLPMLIGNEEIELQRGDLAFIFPAIPHSYKNGTFNRGILMIFDPSFTPDFSRILTLKKPSSPMLSFSNIHPDVRYNLLSICQDISEDRNRLRGSLSVVLSHVLDQMLLTDNPKSGGEKNNFYRLLTYISENFRDSLSLDKVSEAIGINKYHISHLFSEKTGSGFIPYVHSLRVDYACDLLQNSTKSVTMIAYESGFESPSTFHRAFFKLKSMTPLQFRRNNKTQ